MSWLRPWTPANDVLPLVALRDRVLFPAEVSSFQIRRAPTLAAAEAAAAQEHGRFVVVVCQRDAGADEPTIQQLFSIGCVARVVSVEDASPGKIVKLEGLHRASIVDAGPPAAFPRARVRYLPDVTQNEPELDLTIVEMLKDLSIEILVHTGWSRSLAKSHVETATVPRLSDVLAGALKLTAPQQQRLLETLSVCERTAAVLDMDGLEFAPEAEQTSRGWLSRLFGRRG